MSFSYFKFSATLATVSNKHSNTSATNKALVILPCLTSVTFHHSPAGPLFQRQRWQAIPFLHSASFLFWVFYNIVRLLQQP